MINICPAIKKLKPYQGGKPISELERELGLSNIVKLASNENPLPVSPKVLKAIQKSTSEINRYPDGNGFELKRVISKYLSVNTNKSCSSANITLGNGSNDVLELITRAFVCSADDEVIFSQYAFVVYPLVTCALGAKAVVTPAKNFGHDLDAMMGVITDKTKLIFIANPNNPTGTLLSDKGIYSFLKKVPQDVIVVLDQAYFEYLDIEDNVLTWLREFDNLIITRTFSKAYGLAGLRVGYSVSSDEIADYLNRIRQPFNVNNIAQNAAIAALGDKDFLNKSVLSNRQGLKQLSQGFDDLGIEYITSAANFIAVKVNNAKDIYQKLLKKGFIVRPVEMEDYLRISVGDLEENNSFLKTLKNIV